MVHEMSSVTIRDRVEKRIVPFWDVHPQVVCLLQLWCLSDLEVRNNSTALKSRFIDAAVIVCDGAGTVVVTKPEMAQGIGGRMSGLISTSPIPDVIRRIEDEGGIVVDPDHAFLDSIAGVRAAKMAGYEQLIVDRP